MPIIHPPTSKIISNIVKDVTKLEFLYSLLHIVRIGDSSLEIFSYFLADFKAQKFDSTLTHVH